MPDEENAVNLLLKNRWELMGFIRALVWNHQDAEDVFQEVAMVIVKKAKTDETIRNFRAWSKEVARRQVLKYISRKSAQKTASVPVDEMINLACEVNDNYAPDADGLDEEYKAMRGCIENMPEKSRKLIRLRFIESRKYSDIANMIQLTEGTLRRAVSRARVVLMECIQRKIRGQETGA